MLNEVYQKSNITPQGAVVNKPVSNEKNNRNYSHLVGGAHCQTHLIRVQIFNDNIFFYSFLVNSFMAFSVREV
jgi:hypothetical protein